MLNRERESVGREAKHVVTISHEEKSFRLSQLLQPISQAQKAPSPRSRERAVFAAPKVITVPIHILPDGVHARRYDIFPFALGLLYLAAVRELHLCWPIFFWDPRGVA